MSSTKRVYQILILCLAFAVIIPSLFTTSQGNIEKFSSKKFTHTVLAEYCSLSYCPYCPPASSQLYQIYSSHDYPFLFVTLVYDKNPRVRERCEELGVQGFPTVFFDGGYKRVIGEQGSAGPYISAIEECGERSDIYNVALDIIIRDEGNNKMLVNITVYNNDRRAYSGTLRAYVTEIESRWRDASQRPYHFAVLDFAYNDLISVGSGGTLHISAIWDGSEYNIDPENIMVIAALFDSHTDYVDNASYATIYSAYPDTIITSGPSGIINETTVTFTWIGKDRDTPTEDLLYSYKLEPIDTNWSAWTPATTVTYMNLTEGWYKFEVKARNPEGEEDPKPAYSIFAVNLHHPPHIEITKPGRRLCINNRLYPIPIPLVIGGCNIETNVTDEAGIDHVDFYIDGELKYQDSYPPYQYTTWYRKSLLKKHTIKVVAYDTLGNQASDTVRIWKIL